MAEFTIDKVATLPNPANEEYYVRNRMYLVPINPVIPALGFEIAVGLHGEDEEVAGSPLKVRTANIVGIPTAPTKYQGAPSILSNSGGQSYSWTNRNEVIGLSAQTDEGISYITDLGIIRVSSATDRVRYTSQVTPSENAFPRLIIYNYKATPLVIEHNYSIVSPNARFFTKSGSNITLNQYMPAEFLFIEGHWREI